jgi:hypothetical protein
MSEEAMKLPQGYVNRPWDYTGCLYTESQMRAYAAAELRRLHEANEAMLDALNSYMKAGVGNSTDFELQHNAYFKARAAIAKGEQA